MFRFINSMPLQNEYILFFTKAVLVGRIIDWEHINVASIIVKEMLLMARHEQTSFPYLIFITQLSEKAGVSFWGKADVCII